MTQLEITGQLIPDLFKIVVHCLNRQATSVKGDLRFVPIHLSNSATNFHVL